MAVGTLYLAVLTRKPANHTADRIKQADRDRRQEDWLATI
jgi:hypothetical protein